MQTTCHSQLLKGGTAIIYEYISYLDDLRLISSWHQLSGWQDGANTDGKIIQT